MGKTLRRTPVGEIAKIAAVLAVVGLVSGITSTATQAWSYKEAAKPYEGVTIRVLDEITPMQEAFAKVVPEFEKETGIKVEYEILNHFEVINKGQSDMLSGQGFYDVVMNHGFQLGLLLKANVLRPLDDFMADKKLTNPDLGLDQLVEPSWSSLAKFKDKTYGFLNWNYVTVYWARNDLLSHPEEQAAFKAKYGYSLQPAATMAQLRDIAEFFTRKKGEKLAGETLDSDFYGIVMEGLNGGTSYLTVWYTFIKNTGGDVFDENGVPTIDTPGVIKGLSMWADLWKFSPPGQAEYSLLDVPTVMGNGIAAQSLAWSELAFGIDQPGVSKLAGEFTYRPIPSIAGSTSPYNSASVPSHYNISVHAKNPEAAYLFMQWAIDKKTQTRLWNTMGGGQPIRNDLWSLDVFKDSRNASLFEAMRDSMKGAYAQPKLPNYLEIADELNNAFQQVGIGKLTPEEGVARAQKGVLAICEKCGL